MTRSRNTADFGSRAGLAKVIPSSVAVGSGTGSADTIGNVTFSGCSSVSLNDVFSSTYTNYKIILNTTAVSATDPSIALRLRTTTDDSGTNYAWQFVRGAAAVDAETYATETSYFFGGASTTYATRSSAEHDIFSPNLAQATNMSGIFRYTANAGARYLYTAGGTNTSSTQFTGFTLFPSSGTMSGTVRVYGYN